MNNLVFNPPIWMSYAIAAIVGATLVWIAVSFIAGSINQGI